MAAGAVVHGGVHRRKRVRVISHYDDERGLWVFQGDKKMSWNISGTGKPAALAAKLAGDFAKNKCQEPEETIRQGVGLIIAEALKVYPETLAVKFDAGGSQQGHSDGKYTNALSVNIEPVYGFVE